MAVGVVRAVINASGVWPGQIYCNMALKLSPEQVEELKQAFKLLDVDGDGKITPSELRTIMKKFALNPSQEEVNTMIKKIDTDGSGTIELPEFLNFIANKINDPMDEKEELLHVFKLFDKDGNGLITKEELKEGLNKLGERMSEQDILELVEAADIDGDGNINFEEFMGLMKLT